MTSLPQMSSLLGSARKCLCAYQSSGRVVSQSCKVDTGTPPLAAVFAFLGSESAHQVF